MSRLFLVVVIAVTLLGATLASDAMLDNPDVQSQNNTTADQQQQFAETGATLMSAAPIALAALVVGSLLMAVRVMGGG